MRHTKFLKVGVLALASLLTASYTIDKIESNVNDTVVFATDLAKKITILQESNVFPNSKIFLDIKGDNLEETPNIGEAKYSFITQTCDVNLDVDKNIHTGNLITKDKYEEFKDLISAENDIQKN